jgi:N-acetylglucosaminyl-diphospho-decaprenol L-rhamnosyltransferase
VTEGQIEDRDHQQHSSAALGHEWQLQESHVAGVRSLSRLTSESIEHVHCAILIVSYNSAKYLPDLLDSVPAAASGLRTRCIVVDNHSSDETISVLQSRNDVLVVVSDRNLGYSGAINLGRSFLGQCSSVLILNPDLILEAGAICELYEALEPGVGVAVPKLLTGDGGLCFSLRYEPSLARALGDALFGAHVPRRPKWLTDTVRDRSAYGRPLDVEWAGGAALLISSECNDAVGEWDAGRFFLYSEETDFAARARQRGYRIRYVPSASVRHEEGGSGRSPELGALLAVNRVRYFEKYHRKPATWLFRAAVALHYLLRSARGDERAALRAVMRRSSWAGLPGGEPFEEVPSDLPGSRR